MRPVPRVALVHPFSWLDVRRGGERYLHDLAWWLGSQRVAVDVVVGGRPGVERDGSVRIVRIRHPQRLDLRGLGRLDTFGAPALWWLSRHRYDVVHAMTPTAALAGVLTGHRTVYTALGHPTPASLARRRWDARLFRTVVRRVRAPLAYSASAADSIEEVTGVLPRVMPPGIRTDRFPVAPAPPVADPPVLLFPAFAADRRKRLDLLLAAMPAVLTRYPNARVRLVGGGDADWAFALLPTADRDRVRRACDDVGVVELDDMPGHYATSTVTVLPSVEEAFGIVLIESLSSGRPVVALAEGGPTEIVDRPDVGSLVPRDAPDRLAAAILDTIRSAGLPQTAATCHAHARRWGWVEHVGPAHLELYREVARRWP